MEFFKNFDITTTNGVIAFAAYAIAIGILFLCTLCQVIKQIRRYSPFAVSNNIFDVIEEPFGYEVLFSGKARRRFLVLFAISALVVMIACLCRATYWYDYLVVLAAFAGLLVLNRVIISIVTAMLVSIILLGWAIILFVKQIFAVGIYFICRIIQDFIVIFKRLWLMVFPPKPKKKEQTQENSEQQEENAQQEGE